MYTSCFPISVVFGKNLQSIWYRHLAVPPQSSVIKGRKFCPWSLPFSGHTWCSCLEDGKAIFPSTNHSWTCTYCIFNVTASNRRPDRDLLTPVTPVTWSSCMYFRTTAKMPGWKMENIVKWKPRAIMSRHSRTCQNTVFCVYSMIPASWKYLPEWTTMERPKNAHRHGGIS